MFFERVCLRKLDEVCMFGMLSAENQEEQERGRVEVTNLDACWSMHGGM